MKNIKYFLLSFLIIVLFPKYSFAQMISTMLVSSVREIGNTTNFSPVKSLTIRPGIEIVSLANAQYSGHINRPYFVMPNDSIQFSNFTTSQASIFCLSREDTTYIHCKYLNNVTITDFDYDSIENMIYFCGVMNSPLTSQGYYQNIVGKLPLSVLYSSTTNIPIDIFTIALNTPAYLKKVDFYRTPSNQTKKLSLIANDKDNQTNTVGSNNYMTGFAPSYYISFNIDSITYWTFPTCNIRFTDVIHTKDYVVVCGMKDLQTLVLYSHLQDDPNFYVCRSYYTPIMYHHFKDPQYEIAPLIPQFNDFIVGASIKGTNEERLEFTKFEINANIITPQYTQFVIDNNDLECRSRITDMTFNPRDMALYVIACNGCSMLDIRDMIFNVYPYDSTAYYSSIIVPSIAQEGFNLLKSITSYNVFRDYLVFGAKANNPITISQDSILNTGNLCFFDRIIDTSRRETCGEKYSFDLVTIDTYYTENDFQYMYCGITHDTAAYLTLPVLYYSMTYRKSCIY